MYHNDSFFLIEDLNKYLIRGYDEYNVTRLNPNNNITEIIQLIDQKVILIVLFPLPTIHDFNKYPIERGG